MTVPAAAADLAEQLAEKARRLYTLPAVAAEVLKLAQNERLETAALKACVQNDPALTSKILRTVNSSLFGLPRKILDLGQALSLLGTKPLRLLVLGFSLPKQLSAGLEAAQLLQYWRRALTRATAARHLASRTDIDGDEAFIAGLLYDLGVLVLLQTGGESYQNILTAAGRDPARLAALEEAAFASDHRRLGQALLETWSLPSRLGEIVARGHDLAWIDGLDPCLRGVPQAVHVADWLMRLVVDERRDALPWLLKLAARFDLFESSDLTTIVSEVETCVEELASVLALVLPQGRSYDEILLESQTQLALAAEDAFPGARVLGGTGETPPAAGEDIAEDVPENLADRVAALRMTLQKRIAEPDPATSGAPCVSESASFPATSPSAAAIACPVLIARVIASLGSCRHSRCPLSLISIGITDLSGLVATHGPTVAATLQQLIPALANRVIPGSDACLTLAEGRFALIVPDCERQEAVALSRRLIETASRYPVGRGGGGIGPALSVGVATVALPSPNLPPHCLIDAAHRCLETARRGGGALVKSINV